MLRLAGCEEGDLRRLVAADGLEAALQTLLRQGVYLTVDEFKGRRPARRGSAAVVVSPERLRNPLVTEHVPTSTSGSRGAGTAVPIDLASLQERAVNSYLALTARGGQDWVKAHWQVPGAGAVARLLEFGCFGAPPARWFSQVDPAAAGLHPRYRWSARALRWGSLLGGRPFPRPEFAPLSNPLPVARWMAGVLRQGSTPHLFTFTTSAVRLCQAAQEAGLEIAGAQFTLTGEPVTTSRLAVLARAGASAASRYAIIECGAVGFGCQAPEASDDVHLLEDLHAVIQPGSDTQTSLPEDALLLTSLRPTWPFILLNVAMGDRARLAARVCGCPLETYGWPTHLQEVRSYEKLTAGGMTFLDSDVIRVLEDVLPSRFGGGPTDYQIVEDADDDGQPRVRLLVHPAVGPFDEAVVAETFLRALGVGSGAQRVMGLLWLDARLLGVERQPPRTAPSGKILHLHVERRPELTRPT